MQQTSKLCSPLFENYDNKMACRNAKIQPDPTNFLPVNLFQMSMVSNYTEVRFPINTSIRVRTLTLLSSQQKARSAFLFGLTVIHG